MLPILLISQHIFTYLPVKNFAHLVVNRATYQSFISVVLRIQKWYKQSCVGYEILVDRSQQFAVTSQDVFRFCVRKVSYPLKLQILPEKCVNIIGRVCLLDWIVNNFPSSVSMRKRSHLQQFFRQLSVAECQKCLRFLHQQGFFKAQSDRI